MYILAQVVYCKGRTERLHLPSIRILRFFDHETAQIQIAFVPVGIPAHDCPPQTP